jgi:hypothetical protein
MIALAKQSSSIYKSMWWMIFKELEGVLRIIATEKWNV